MRIIKKSVANKRGNCIGAIKFMPDDEEDIGPLQVLKIFSPI